MLEPVRPGAVSHDRALRLPTFSHFVIVNKTSLSLSLSLSLSATPFSIQAHLSNAASEKNNDDEVMLKKGSSTGACTRAVSLYNIMNTKMILLLLPPRDRD